MFPLNRDVVQEAGYAEDKKMIGEAGFGRKSRMANSHFTMCVMLA